jgi:hypothetical protein
MVQGRRGPGFPLETRGEFLLGDFDGYHAVEACIARLVDLTHATGAGRPQDFEGAEPVTDRQCHKTI